MNKKYYRAAVSAALVSEDEFNLIINKNLSLSPNLKEIVYYECTDFKARCEKLCRS